MSTPDPETRDTPLSSAEVWRPFIEHSPESVVVRDLKGRIVTLNRAAEALYGHSRTRLAGRSFHHHFKSRPAALIAKIERQLADGQGWTGEVLRRTASGQEVRVQAKWVRAGADGIIEYSHALASPSDIERDADHQRHRYTNLFQAMAAAFWELDFSRVRQMIGRLAHSGVSDFAAYFDAHPAFIDDAIAATRVLDVNEATVRLFRAGSAAHMIGGNIDAYWPPESRDVFRDSVLASIHGLPGLSRETQLRTLSGERIDARFTVCFPAEADKRGPVLVGVIDLTERVNAERRLRASNDRYRSLFHAMTTALVEIDTRALQARFAELRQEGVASLEQHLDTRPEFIAETLELCPITEVNEAAVRLYGARFASQLIGRSVAPYWPPASYAAVRRAFATSFYNAAGFEMETKNRRLTGEDIDVHLRLNASRDLRARGRVLLSLTDITDQVATRQALAAMQSEFAHASRLSTLGEMVASMAHEINQPLTAIAIHAAAANRLIERSKTGPNTETSDLLAINRAMGDDARRASDIIQTIRAMAAKATPKRAILDINRLVREALGFLEPEIRLHGVEVVIEDSDTPAPVLADRIHLYQVTVNLVMNALQEFRRHAQVAPSPLVHVAIRQDGGTVSVSIADNGQGLSQTTLQNLFTRFYTTKPTGLGLGLAICKTLIEDCGGTIGAENLDRGARFTFILPLATPEEIAAASRD